jgi:PAS domain S-box-containing protein
MTALITAAPEKLAPNHLMTPIFESIPTGVVALDPNGKIVSFNRTAEQITGLDAKDVLGRTFDGVFKADYFHHPALNIKDILSTK